MLHIVHDHKNNLTDFSSRIDSVIRYFCYYSRFGTYDHGIQKGSVRAFVRLSFKDHEEASEIGKMIKCCRFMMRGREGAQIL